MPKNTDILSANQEFFTIVSSGESGVSIRGLAKLSGIPKSTLTRWFDSDLSGKSVPDPLKALPSKGNPVTQKEGMEGLKALPSKGNPVTQNGEILYLAHEIKVRNNPIKAVRSDIAAQVIQYAAFELGKDEAKESLKSFIAIGLDSFIQGATGYLPEQYQSATKDPRYEIHRLVKEPNPWKLLYSKEVCDRVRCWYFPRDFFWKFAYGWMTTEEIEFLNEHNPVMEGIWQRRDRIFQFLSDETRDRLAPEIAALCLLIETSTSRQDFETRYNRKNGLDQQEFVNV